MIRIAIVDAGYIGQLHTHILHREFNNVSVIAIVEKEEKKGRELASHTGVMYYSDFEIDLPPKTSPDILLGCSKKTSEIDRIALLFRKVTIVQCADASKSCFRIGTG